MHSKIKSTLGLAAAGAMIASGTVVGVAAPANAAWGGSIYHYTPDAGYDDSIIVFCDWPDAFYPDGSPKSYEDASDPKRIYEGQNSTSKCGDDTDVVWVRRNEEITCRFIGAYPGTYVWKKTWDAYGPHKFTSENDYTCVVGTD